jgi:uncharacterized membrane protein
MAHLRNRYRIAVLVCHALLAAGIALGMASSTLPIGARLGLATVALLPLIAAIPGLARSSRYTYQWVTVALVIYIGMAAVEVVASLARSLPATIVLFAALIELFLLLGLIRMSEARRAHGERTGS